jgi:hypothetical protein
MLLQFCHKLSKSLKSDAGAINATGALLGLVITGAAGGVAATSSTELIQTAQDMAARQNASQIGTAQGLSLVMDGSYKDLAGLESAGHMPAYRAAMGPRRFATESGAGGKCFVVVSRSVTGKAFFTTDLIPAPEPLEPGIETGCLPASQVQAMARALDAAAAATGS